MKKILISFLILASFFVTGCSNKLDPFDVSEIEDFNHGFCILNSEGTCYPLPSLDTDSSETDILRKSINGNTIIFSIFEDRLEKIPILKREDSLILKTTNEIEESFPIVSLTDYGYSVGIIFQKKGDTNTYGFSNLVNTFSTGSSAEEKLKSRTRNTNNVQVLSIGGQVLEENFLSDINTIKDLKKDFLYKINLLEGTNEVEEILTADTKYLVSKPEQLFYQSEKTFTNNGYIILDLNEELPSGYYYIGSIQNNFGGIFLYDND